MKLNMDGAPAEVREGDRVEVGNVYATQKNTLYLIVSLQRNGDAVALAIEADGTITNAVRYGRFYFANRKLVGRATNLADIDVEWL